MASSYSNRHDGVPDAVASIAQLMSSFPAHWALCGGWALDAFLGRVTRPHHDTDVAIFSQDQALLVSYLAGWQLLAHGPAWEPGGNDQWWDGSIRLSPGTHIHARPPHLAGPMPENGIARDEDRFDFEFYLDERSGDDWILWREPEIRVPVEAGLRASVWGVNAVAPEVALFFKSREMRHQDIADFQAILPHLTQNQRLWLREAIEQACHPWIRDLAAL